MNEIRKSFTVMRMIRLTRAKLQKEDLLAVNRALNQLRKP
jgi:hypothetical protein